MLSTLLSRDSRYLLLVLTLFFMLLSFYAAHVLKLFLLFVLCFLFFSPSMRLPTHVQATYARVVSNMLDQLESRFRVSIPSPSSEDYFPSELLASALDPSTKGLSFVARKERHKVLPQLPFHSFNPHHAYLQIWSKLLMLMEQVKAGDHLNEDLEVEEEINKSEDSDDDLFRNLRQGSAGTLKEELEMYKQVPPIHPAKESSLAWWKRRAPDFPHLAVLARVRLLIFTWFALTLKIYLAFPASSASVERLFSTGSLAITKHRYCVAPDLADCLITGSHNAAFDDYLCNRTSQGQDHPFQLTPIEPSILDFPPNISSSPSPLSLPPDPLRSEKDSTEVATVPLSQI